MVLFVTNRGLVVWSTFIMSLCASVFVNMLWQAIRFQAAIYYIFNQLYQILMMMMIAMITMITEQKLNPFS